MPDFGSCLIKGGKKENMPQMLGRSATISCFSQSRHLWLSYVVRLVEGTITSVCECFEILYTSHHMDKR